MGASDNPHSQRTRARQHSELPCECIRSRHKGVAMKSKSGSDFLVLWKYSEAPRVNALVMVGAEGTRHCGHDAFQRKAGTAMSKLPTPRRRGCNVPTGTAHWGATSSRR